MYRCTVAIPVYNRETLVRGALESALAQDVAGLDVLVVDNCSTDGTWVVLQGYSDSRLRLVRNDTNVGLFGNLDRCLALAEGTYLRILCSDDRLTPGCLAREIETMEANPGVALLSTRAMRIDAEGRQAGVFADNLAPGVYPGTQLIGDALWVLSHYCVNALNYPSGILLRTEAARRGGSFQSDYRLVGDLDFWFRVLTLGDGVIAEHVGCEVMAHAGQEGQQLFDAGEYMTEWIALARRWDGALAARGLSRRVRAQMGACALWAASYCWRQGQRASAGRNWRAALACGAPRASLAAACLRFVAMQAVRRTAGVRLRPPAARPTRSDADVAGELGGRPALREERP